MILRSKNFQLKPQFYINVQLKMNNCNCHKVHENFCNLASKFVAKLWFDFQKF